MPNMAGVDPCPYCSRTPTPQLGPHHQFPSNCGVLTCIYFFWSQSDLFFGIFVLIQPFYRHLRGYSNAALFCLLNF